MSLIELANISKSFGKHVAVDDLSLSVPKEVFMVLLDQTDLVKQPPCA